MKFKRVLIGGLIGLTLLSQSGIMAFANTISYEVKSGDTYWKISDKYDIDLNNLLEVNSAYSNPYLDIGQTISLPFDSQDKNLYKVKSGDTYWKVSQNFGVNINELLQVNNADANTHLVVNDVIVIPKEVPGSNSDSATGHVVKYGDTYWKLSEYYKVDIQELLKLNNANEYSELNIGQSVLIPKDGGQAGITYKNYTVQKGDDFWKIAIRFGIPQQELIKANNMNKYTVLNIGDILKIPVHNIPIKSTPGPQYGEYLDWWSEAQYVVPIGKVFTVRDYYTGKQWTMKRTIGANHADVEPVTSGDAEIMKQVWGGSYSWDRRPVIVIVDGRKLAASAASMPHDIQYIYNNNFNGHMDIHFSNSTRHKDGAIDYDHQGNIKIAAGIR